MGKRYKDPMNFLRFIKHIIALSVMAPAAHAASSSNLNTESAVSAASAPAKPARPPSLKADPATLSRIEEYLNGITTIVADFTQVAPDGSLTAGKFSLKRPGKMRWQYNPPTPLLMVASGGEIIYYDYELEQVTHIPLESTLAGFLAKEIISFADPAVTVEGIEKQAGAVRLTLIQPGRESEGRLMLEFSDNPLQIRNMVVTDAQGQTTTVSLNNARFGLPLDNSLFVFKDPRKKQRT